MKNSLLKNFFSSGLQAVAVQVMGVLFFYVISLFLAKDDFGVISWANAISILFTTALSFGLEQVVVRRIATSRSSEWAAAAFFVHAIIGSVVMLLILLAAQQFWPQQQRLQLLPWFFAAQAVLYIAIPLKQFLNAKEQFTPYGAIAFFSNLIKLALAAWFIRYGILTISEVLYILLTAAFIELIALLIYVKFKAGFSFRFKWKAYPKLIKEAAPQYVAMIFDSSLSRLDWVLLGIISTNAVTADYSFAFRAFEVAKLPLVVIGPVLLVRFSRQLTKGHLTFSNEKKKELNELLTIEMFLAMLLPLCLNIIWAPWLDIITDGKYGSSNAIEFLLLSLCLPFQFFINLLWTISFAGKKYRSVSRITMIAAIVNLALNLALIPLYGGMGAAIAFITTVIVQASAYYILVSKHTIAFSIIPLVLLLALATGAYFAAIALTSIVWLQLIVAIVVYIALSVATKQVSKKHINTLKAYLKK